MGNYGGITDVTISDKRRNNWKGGVCSLFAFIYTYTPVITATTIIISMNMNDSDELADIFSEKKTIARSNFP